MSKLHLFEGHNAEGKKSPGKGNGEMMWLAENFANLNRVVIVDLNDTVI